MIIPARPGEGSVPAVEAALRLDYPLDRLEILLARGRQPSVQRNVAVREASGDLIYFLDDDALADVGNLRRAVEHFRDPSVWMVGGPNLCPQDAPELEQVFAVVLSTWLAFMSSRARYDAFGSVRRSGEKELILCNLLSRREPFLQQGGFDESLYPNEENALMDAFQKGGGILLYDPDLSVQRRPRPSLRAFARMVFTYGRGRAEQFRLHPSLGSVPNFVPPVFCLYLLLLPWLGLLGLLPLAAYALLVAAQTLVSCRTKGAKRSLLAAPLILLTHVGYGLGFWRGLFTRVRSPAAGGSIPVILQRISLEEP